MTPSITTKVTPTGDVQMEYTGFAGDECLTEAERLGHEIAALGLQLQLSVHSRNRVQETSPRISQSAQSKNQAR